MRPGFWLPVLSLVASLTVATTASHAGNPFVTVPSNYDETPAAVYAGLSAADCIAELDRRAIPHLAAPALLPIDAPIHLAGPLHGVTFAQENRSADEALNSDGAVVDCRLALALDDFSLVLAERGVDRVDFISAYRRDVTGSIPAGQRHPSGLAIDLSSFHHKDGTTWSVERDFLGRIGARTCGRGAQEPASRNAAALGFRRLVCDVGASRIFNLVLTPNYDAEHHNHMHVEVRRDIRWFLVH